ncbi:hypothetical protein WICPIJ_003662 [Wickerhamomyces pijperi]|uniref:Uncharacterized protein n=1 Tax=Wickerhamomyces pijperi TaxID=599730 RepID=A0A9P8Q993_WICPI|nr:hypothetical protein WICPIJ_003662 [Wickerhamomyces pijperi]
MIHTQSYQEFNQALQTQQDHAIRVTSLESMVCTCHEDPNHHEISKAIMEEYMRQNFHRYEVTKDTEGFTYEVLNKLEKDRALTAHKLSRAMPQATTKPQVKDSNSHYYYLSEDLKEKYENFESSDNSDNDSLYREIKKYKTFAKLNKTKMAKVKKVLMSLLPAFKRSKFTKAIDYESDSSEIVHLEDFGSNWSQTFKEMRSADWEHFKYLTKDQYFC